MMMMMMVICSVVGDKIIGACEEEYA